MAGTKWAEIMPELGPEDSDLVLPKTTYSGFLSSDIEKQLQDRGILYTPDYVVNAGGATAFGLRSLGESDDATLRSRVEKLGDTLTAIFAESAERDESPLLAAERRVQRRLDSGEPPTA